MERVKRKLIFGLTIKIMGYIFTVSGIFISIIKPAFALNVIYFGILLVIIGWIVIMKSFLFE